MLVSLRNAICFFLATDFPSHVGPFHTILAGPAHPHVLCGSTAFLRLSAHLLFLFYHGSLGIKFSSQFPQAFSKLELNLCFSGACPAQEIFMEDTAYEGR